MNPSPKITWADIGVGTMAVSIILLVGMNIASAQEEAWRFAIRSCGTDFERCVDAWGVLGHAENGTACIEMQRNCTIDFGKSYGWIAAEYCQPIPEGNITPLLHKWICGDGDGR